MKNLQILLISNNTNLIDFIHSDKHLDALMKDVVFNTREHFTIDIEADLFIVDINDSSIDLSELRYYAKSKPLILFLDKPYARLDKLIDMSVFSILYRPYDIGMLYFTLNNVLHQIKSSKKSTHHKTLEDLDYLTGVLNRRGMYKEYETIPANNMLNYMFIDIDDFKDVNDLYGHSTGDRLLVQVTKILQNNITDGTVYRVGGDEFVVLLRGLYDEPTIMDIAKKFLAEVAHIKLGEDITTIISLSIGIIMNQKPDEELDNILYKCDSAMYQAKRTGKNKLILFSDIEKDLLFKKSITKEKEHALASGEFVVYLQPKMNMITQSIYGAEALVRWNHPKDGIRLPEVFLPSFEESGFITELDMYVFDEVCKLKKKWKNLPIGKLFISCNMSRLHIHQENFVNDLLAITKKYKVSPNELEIEFTESIFIKDSKEMIKAVTELKEAGFTVSVDDFGSGYSTLNILKDTPIDTIKIDKEFFAHFDTASKSKRIIRSIISMAKDLRLETVAEGVESIDQIFFLTSCGCEYAQGFIYSEALPVDKYEEFANANLIVKERMIKYSFRDNFVDDSTFYPATYSGTKYRFVKGVSSKIRGVHINGGRRTTNTLYLPNEVISPKSFTVTFWMFPDELSIWSSVFFAQFESGFLSIVPLAWDGVAIARIRDERERGGWYDAGTMPVETNKWNFIAVSYDSKSETLRIYINAELAGVRDFVPAPTITRRVMVGGDVYKKSFKGSLCELCIFDQVKSSQDLRKMYLEAKGEKW